jgi:ornithine decarboxylase
MVIATAVLDNYAQNVTHNHMLTKKPLLAGLQYNDHNAVITSKQLIGDALRQRVEGIDHEMCDPGEEDTFFVADLGEVYRQHLRWKKNLPRIKPFYGMSMSFVALCCSN